jgi:hypothetical protein
VTLTVDAKSPVGKIADRLRSFLLDEAWNDDAFGVADSLRGIAAAWEEAGPDDRQAVLALLGDQQAVR